MNEILKTEMYHAEDENLRINFHINMSPWSYLHIHSYWEIQILLDGEVTNVINNSTHTLSRGEIQILRPSDVHLLKHASLKQYECLNLEIKLDNFARICNELHPQCLKLLEAKVDRLPVLFLNDSNLTKIKDCVRHAQQELDVVDEKRQYYLTKILIICLEEFINNEIINEKKEKYSFSDEFVKRMSRPENIGLKLNEICKQIPCSVEYAIRMFKSEGKSAPNKVFRKIKLDYACGLLRFTEYKIISISEIIGFGSLWYFNKIFLEAYGITPSQYRKKYFRK